jgi:uncharacterized protein YndB with AHSA1/START domain
MADIQHFLDIKAPADKVYNAVTEQKGIASWWVSDAAAKPEIGAVIEFNVGKPYHTQIKVTNLIENKLVSWECIGGDKEWVGTKMQFELSENDKGGTNLTFKHTGWAAQSFLFGLCSFHWAGYMKSLRDYCETGKGIPDSSGRF